MFVIETSKITKESFFKLFFFSVFVGTPHTLSFKLFERATDFEGVFVCAPVHVLTRSENMSS